jgi:hypothetical protein
VDALPDTDLDVAQHILVGLRRLDPVDDEPLTDDEQQAIEAARAAYRRGEWVSGGDVRREIGWWSGGSVGIHRRCENSEGYRPKQPGVSVARLIGTR